MAVDFVVTDVGKQTMSMLLNSRFSADDRPSIELNDLQLEFIEKVKFKLSQGIYVYESVPCAICGSTSLELIAEKDRYGFLMQVSAVHHHLR